MVNGFNNHPSNKFKINILYKHKIYRMIEREINNRTQENYEDQKKTV